MSILLYFSTPTEIIESVFLIYSGIIMSHYILLSMYSGFLVYRHMNEAKVFRSDVLLRSRIHKKVSIIVPAYNEEKSILQCIKSLQNLEYSEYEVIIVNDGSTDRTIDLLKYEFFLEEALDYSYHQEIKTKKVRAIYKSSLLSCDKLIVVDKENGGKADALNAGLNVASNELYLAIDADSILASNALLKLLRPFFTESDQNIVATGGVVRIANSCDVIEGTVAKVNLSKKPLVRMQILEYTRVFMMSRFAWSRLNGLMLISGAIGMFKRDLVIACGGYAHVVGEDMELVVRLRRHLYEKKIPFKIGFVPDPLCWTEVPETTRSLFKQADRWMRGTIETLVIHRKLFFNRKYKSLGILGYPFWLFCEWLAPIVEFVGVFTFAILVCLNYVGYELALTLFAVVYLFAIFYSAWAIAVEELTFHRYSKRSDLFRLGLCSLCEPFFLHVIRVLAAVKANYSYFVQKKSIWGRQERRGFKIVDKYKK